MSTDKKSNEQIIKEAGAIWEPFGNVDPSLLDQARNNPSNKDYRNNVPTSAGIKFPLDTKNPTGKKGTLTFMHDPKYQAGIYLFNDWENKQHVRVQEEGIPSRTLTTQEIEKAVQDIEQEVAEQEGYEQDEYEGERVSKAITFKDPDQQLQTYYKQNERALVYGKQKKKGSDKALVWEFVSTPVTVVAVVESMDGSESVMVQFTSHHTNQQRTVVLSRESMIMDAKSALAPLASKGLLVKKGMENVLIDYFNFCKPSSSVIYVDRCGWIPKHGIYVTPDKIYGAKDKQYQFVHATANRNQLMKVQGTLDEWRTQVFIPSLQSRRITLNVVYALSSILYEPLGVQGSALHHYGDSSLGKTTSVQVGASVFGNGSEDNGYLNTWNNSPTSLENFLELHTNAVMVLDEMHLARGEEINEIIYMLVAGTGRGRGTVTGGVQVPHTWTTCCISTGEYTVEQHILRGTGREAATGISARMLSLYLPKSEPMGMIDGITGTERTVERSREIIDSLKNAVGKYYGSAADRFLEHLYDQEHLLKVVENYQGYAQARYQEIPPYCTALQRRVYEIFILCHYTIGVMYESGIIQNMDELKQVEESINFCWDLYLQGDEGDTLAEHKDVSTRKVLDRLDEVLEMYGENSFTHNTGEYEIQPHQIKMHYMGGRMWVHDTDGSMLSMLRTDMLPEEKAQYRLVYFMLPTVFKNWVCTSLSVMDSLHILKEQGRLIMPRKPMSEKEKNKGFYQWKVYISGRSFRAYAVLPPVEMRGNV